MILLAVITGDVGFEATAAVKLAVESTGTITNFTILEKMDINKAAELPLKLWLVTSLLVNYSYVNFQFLKVGS